MINVVFFDTDCLSSFLWTDTEYILINAFGSRMQLPRYVYNELIKVETLKAKVNILIKQKKIEMIDFSFNSAEATLFYQFTKKDRPVIGSGEAAAIALAIERKGMLASNNLRDVKSYVEKYNLRHVTTGSILEEAYLSEFITITVAEAIWQRMIFNGLMLPADTFEQYLNLPK